MSNLKKYIEEAIKLREYSESSISRILIKHMFEHDTGTITAYRDEFNHKLNQLRNKSLKANLLHLGYRVISVKGSFIEDYNTKDAKEVGEHVFFVVDWRDKKNLERDLDEWGKRFEQDSVLYIPKGAKISFLIGLKEGVFPGLGVHKELPILKFGKENEFMTRVNGRPFFFTEEILGEYVCANNTSRGYTSLEAKKHWSELTLEEGEEY